MRILKFGGTSVADAERIGRVVELVDLAAAAGPVVVVVSAMGGVTNALVRATDLAASRDASFEAVWREVLDRHVETARAVAAATEAEELAAAIAARHDDLHDLLRGVFLLRECSPRTRDSILSYGERTSALLVAAALRREGRAARAVDARELIVTDASFGRAVVNREATSARLTAALEGATESLAVVTGFIAATEVGETTTLGRGGSDLTAALVGAALGAEAIELWTDVSGVMSADPRLVPDAFPLPRLSYSELVELSHFGAKVVFPPTVHPARELGIPLLIKNTLDPEAPGTLVEEGTAPNPYAVRGISSIREVALMRLEGDGMVGVPGIAMRLFGALARRDVSVILISQGSSEHSICFAVAPGDSAAAEHAVRDEFALERRVGLVEPLVVDEGMSVVAAVGEEMRERPGIAGRLFGVLGDHGVNVRAIAQGSSELNVSFVVASRDERAAVNAIHHAFFGAERHVIDVVVLGAGRVGSELLDQVRDVAEGLLEREGLELRVVAVGTSRRLAADSRGLELGHWREDLADGEAWDADPVPLLEGATAASRVIVDCTASDATVDWYPRALEAGVGVVSANKKPFAGPLATFRSIRELASAHAVPVRFEATVGAGLPVVRTIDDLTTSGDWITEIDGILSGTLNFLTDRLEAGERFSDAVRHAHEAGLTEPRPWDDLSGEDVRRKLLIAARLAGVELEPGDVEVEPLLPGGDWPELELDELWERLPEVDDGFADLQGRAAERGARLRYLARLGDGQARVGLVEVGPDHPAFGVTGVDNLVAIRSARYARSPLVVRGPGAGPDVTAAAVLADLVQVARELRRS